MQSDMIIARTRSEAQTWREAVRRDGKTIAFVPTMGALHEGHLSLVRLGLAHADLAAASIFVNPTQFAAHEDLASYPRNEERDLSLLAAAGCSFVYCPEAREIYPDGDATRVLVKGLSHILEGVPRPHFFEGVATVVSRLFLHLSPEAAVFGEKDWQQLQIIRRMVSDLGFPVKIIGGPTVREPDGLAMSSRNAYLAPVERQPAAAIFAAMSGAGQKLEAGEALAPVLAGGAAEILAAGLDGVDYFEARHASSLEPFAGDAADPGAAGRILVAARLGRTRLIDNIPFRRPG